MNTVHVYTIANWRLLMYLWPKGTKTGNQYTVYIGEAKSELAKLRKVSQYLADQVAVWSDSGIVVFINHTGLRG